MKIRCETQIFNRNTKANSSVGTTKATLAVGVNKKIGLAERTFKHGDFVRRMTAGSRQLGYVRDRKITADVKIIGLPYVIKNVAAERLRPLSIWQRDCTVCLDSWAGSVKDVDERAVLKGVNGVRFEIHSSDFYHFEEPGTSGRPKVFTPLIFFPGNKVVGRLPWTEKAIILTPDIPLPLDRKGSMLWGQFVVESVRTEGLIVTWKIRSDLYPYVSKPKPYVSAQQLKNLKRLNVFESCVLKISDRSYLTYEPEDMLISKSKWDKEIATRFKEIFQQQQRQQTSTTVSSDTSELSTEVEDSEEENIEYKNSVNTPFANIYNVPEATRFKEIFQQQQRQQTSTVSSDTSELSTEVEDSEEENIEYKNSVNTPFANMDIVPEGKELMTEALLVYSTVSVVWQDGTVEHDIPSTELYPIEYLDNHDFLPGDFTLLPREDPMEAGDERYGVIQTVDHQGRTAKVKWFEIYTFELEQNFSPKLVGESEVSVYDLQNQPFMCVRGGLVTRRLNFTGDDAICTVGYVLDNCIDGRVKIAWVDGHTSCCYPYHLKDVDLLDDKQNDYDYGYDDEVEGLDNAERTFAGRDFQYFFEDQVFLIDKAGRVKFGLIIETCETYFGDEDDENDDEKLGHGDVRVAWYPHGLEHVRSKKTANTKENKCATTSNVEIIQHATGLRYMVRDNIVKKFLEDGEATICFKEPPENLIIKCDPIKLKAFLQALAEKQNVTINLNIASTTAIPQQSQPQLELFVCKPADYPTKGFPRTLKKLVYFEMKLDRISSEIYSLKNLTILNLNSNKIKKIPRELGELNLKVLLMLDNALGELNNWEWLRGVNIQKSLHTLNICSNDLSFFPEELLKCTTLNTLDLSANYIPRIPFEIRRMRGLRHLYISFNQLQSLPSAFNHISLETLDVRNNPFEPYLEHAEIRRKNPSPLWVLSAGNVSKHKMSYTSATIPFTLVDFLDEAPKCACGKVCEKSETVLERAMLATFKNSKLVFKNNHIIYMDIVVCGSKCMGLREMHA